jgi:conserved domain protein
MGYMLIGTFLVAGSMGALELDQIGYMQFLIQSIIGLAISLYGFYKDRAEMDAEEREGVAYTTKVRNRGEYCRNPYYN